MKEKRWRTSARTDTTSPRAFLMSCLTMADDHLSTSASCVASGDIDGLRVAFAKFIACTKASAETLADAIAEMKETR